MHFKPIAVEGFWRFVYERQEIWHRRFVLKQQPPWTKDPVLQRRFFTNVYRELDRGTVYLMRHILDSLALVQPFMPFGVAYLDQIFNVLYYRLFNHIPTYEAIGTLRASKFDYLKIGILLEDRRRQGHTVFTGAFRVTPARFADSDSKVKNICYALSLIQKDMSRIADDLTAAQSLQKAHEVIADLPGFGAFLAYEVVTDLDYPNGALHFTEDDWVNPGPGCRKGISYMMDQRATYDDVEVIKHLRYRQIDYFSEYGLFFHYYKGKGLTLRNIEHSLCEWSKYERLCAGEVIGKHARRFDAGDRKNDLVYS